MKNYYETLNVDRKATPEEIKGAYEGISETLRSKAEVEAYAILSDPETRRQYDEKLEAKEKKKAAKEERKAAKNKGLNEVAEEAEVIEEPVVEGQEEVEEAEVTEEPVVEGQEEPKKNKIAVYASIAVLAAGAVLIIGGIGYAIKNSNNKKGDEIKNDNTPKITATPTPGVTVTPRPTVKPEVIEKDETKEEVKEEIEEPVITQRPTPTPIVAEKVEVIESANITAVSKYLTEEYAKKGFVVETNDIRAALLTTDIKNIEEAELEDILANSTIGNEFNRASLYMTYLTSHNIGNCVYGGDVTKYVSASDLIYNNEDSKAIINHFDEINIWLIKSINDGTLTKEQYNAIVNYVFNFYLEIGSIEVDDKEYGYSDTTIGDKLALQMGTWPTFYAATRIHEYADDQATAKLDAINKKAIDGLDYVSEFGTCKSK